MKSSTNRASPHDKSAQGGAPSGAMSAPQVATRRVPHALIFVMQDVTPAFQEALHAAGFDVAPLDKMAVSQAIASDELPCALMWSDPTHCLARAIEEGTSIAEAIEGWRARAEEILTLLRKNRRHITLVESDLLTASNTDPAWEVLRKRLSIPKDVVLSQPGAQSALSRSVARLAVPQIESLREVLEELRASGISPANEGSALATLEAAAAVFEDLRASQDELALLGAQVRLQVEEAEESSEERGLLQSQVMLVTQEMQRLTAVETAFEAQKLERDDDQEELALLREQVQLQLREAHRASEESAALREQLNRLTQDSKRLRTAQTALESRHVQALRDKDQALAQAAQDLGHAMTLRAELEAQNAKLGHDVEGLTTMLAMVYESTSWRVTAPLRSVRRLVSK